MTANNAMFLNNMSNIQKLSTLVLSSSYCESVLAFLIELMNALISTNMNIAITTAFIKMAMITDSG